MENASDPAISAERLNSFLESHLIDAELLRADRFDAFMKGRQSRLLKLIEEAVGKPAYAGRFAEEGDEVEDNAGLAMARD